MEMIHSPAPILSVLLGLDPSMWRSFRAAYKFKDCTQISALRLQLQYQTRNIGKKCNSLPARWESLAGNWGVWRTLHYPPKLSGCSQSSWWQRTSRRCRTCKKVYFMSEHTMSNLNDNKASRLKSVPQSQVSYLLWEFLPQCRTTHWSTVPFCTHPTPQIPEIYCDFCTFPHPINNYVLPRDGSHGLLRRPIRYNTLLIRNTRVIQKRIYAILGGTLGLHQPLSNHHELSPQPPEHYNASW